MRHGWAATRAEARRAGDRARATLEVDRALLLAVEGVRLDDSPETQANLLAVLSEHPGLMAPERTSGVPFVAANPAGDRLVTYADGELAVRDARTLDVVAASDGLAASTAGRMSSSAPTAASSPSFTTATTL